MKRIFFTLIVLLIVAVLTPNSILAANPNEPCSTNPDNCIRGYFCDSGINRAATCKQGTKTPGALGRGSACYTTSECISGYICMGPVNNGTCQIDTIVDPINAVFGKILPPRAVSNIGSGSQGISQFLNTAIKLIYLVGILAFVFMILISALQWIFSAGDKEKVAAARNRLTYAIIGIVLLALAWVIIKLVGQITGFEFFAGQSSTITRDVRACDPDGNNCRLIAP